MGYISLCNDVAQKWLVFVCPHLEHSPPFKPTTLHQPRLLLMLSTCPISDDTNGQRVSFIVVVLTCIQKCLVCTILILYLFILFEF